MWKRIIAGIVGAIAVLASIVPLMYAGGILTDDPHQLFWSDVGPALIMSALAAALLWIGARFLRFAGTGRSKASTGWLRPVLLGVGFFFPGFVLSLPLTMLWARHRSFSDESLLVALCVSLGIGVAAAIICCVVLLKKRKLHSKTLPV